MKREERKDDLFKSLEPLIRGIGMVLIDLSVFHGGRGGVQVKTVVMTAELDSGDTGVEDCARAHRLIMPRLELAFPGREISLEVSSPGINRLIRDGSEFAHFIGRELKVYRTDISDWTTGILHDVDEEKIVVLTEGGETILSYETIAKARLCGALRRDEQVRGAFKNAMKNSGG